MRHSFIPLLTQRTAQRRAKSLYSVSSIEEVRAWYRHCIDEVAFQTKTKLKLEQIAVGTETGTGFI
jgi:hypothetical protein